VKNMAKYVYTSEQTKLLKVLKQSIKVKTAGGWSRDAGAGFIAEDIQYIELYRLNKKYPHMIAVHAREKDPSKINFLIADQSISDYNLRETEELLRYVQEILPNTLNSGQQIAKRLTDLTKAIDLSPRIMMSDKEFNGLLGMHKKLGEVIKKNRLWGL